MRNILKIVLLVCSLILVTACNGPSLPEGVWTVSYRVSPEGEKSSSANKYIFDFVGDSLKFLEIGQQATGKIDGVHLDETAVFDKTTGRYLPLSEDSVGYILTSVTRDSMVVGVSFDQTQLVLKRLKKHLHKPLGKHNLIGKAFKSETPGIKHELDFTDSVYIINTIGDFTERVKWSLVSYKGHQFLNSNSFYLLLSLRQAKENKIVLTNRYTSVNDNLYKPLSPKYKKEQLYGRWLLHNGESVIPAPLPEDLQAGITITESHLIRHAKALDGEAWELSNDGQYIYRPKSEKILFRILDLTDSTLTLEDIYSPEFLRELSEEKEDLLSTNFVSKYIKGNLD